MARRRLNKKVALVGSAVLVLILLGAIFVMLHFSEDAQGLIREADTAIAGNDYKRAEGALRGAYSAAKTDDLRKEVLVKLVSVYIETDQWPITQWCWGELIRIEPGHAWAWYCRLMYIYLAADSIGSASESAPSWEMLKKTASDFLDTPEAKSVFDEETAQWDIFKGDLYESVSSRLGPLAYLSRGRANLELAVQGRTTDAEEALSQAVADLEKVLELEPDNITAYRHLARTALERGKILAERGSYAERNKIVAEAETLLKKAVSIAPDDPQSHINLLNLKVDAARMLSPDQVQGQIEALEKEHRALAEKFASSADVFGELADYYADRAYIAISEMGLKHLNEAIKAADKAMALESKSVRHATRAADLYYRMYSLYGDVANVNKGIEIAKLGLKLPGAQDTEGPRRYANVMAKYTLNSFIAHCAIEQILDMGDQLTEEAKNSWLLEAESAVHAIEQIQRSEDNPQVMQWRGMLNLAKENRRSALRELYTAYQRLKSLKPASPPWPVDLRFGYLCHRLARVLKDSGEDGAVVELLVDGLNSYVAIMKPQARLDYSEVALKFRRWIDVRENINAFERRFGPTERSRLLRIKGDIGAGHFDQARDALAGMNEKDPNTVRLSLELVEAKAQQIRLAIAQKEKKESLLSIGDSENGEADAGADAAMAADLKALDAAAAQLVVKLFDLDPETVKLSSVTASCRFHILQGELDKAKSLIGRFLQHNNGDVSALVFRAGLSEPDPSAIPMDRMKEIRYEVLSSVSDPARRALGLGVFHRGSGDLEKGAAEFKKVLDMPVTVVSNPEWLIFEQPEEIAVRRDAAGHLFDIALQEQDLEEARRIAELAKAENLDACGGQVFGARLAMAREDFEEALTRINECIKQRPVFSKAYMLRSNINAKLGKDELTVLGDMRRAASLNPLNEVVTKGLADALFRRNARLGDDVTSGQMVEARKALEIAISLNPRDTQLLDLYAAYLAEDEPLRAIAILQDRVARYPDMPHALRLAQLAVHVAKKEDDAKVRNALFDVAQSALDTGKRLDPANVTMLQLYAEYFRAKGEDRKAEEMLQLAKQDQLLWRHYVQRGQYAEAMSVLKKLYEADPKVRDVLTGLLLVSERIKDKEQVKKYATELIALDNGNMESYLVEIQSYLRVGLVQEAEYKLESFTERFPDEPRTLLLRAWLAMRKGQLEKALALTNKNLEIDEENAVAWRLRGEINLFMANISEAVNDLMRSKALLDESATRVSLAKAYLQQRRYEDAITELKNTVNAPGASEEARTLLEHVYRRLGRGSALREFYQETISRYPESVQWLNRAGAFAVSSGEYDRAGDLYQKACELRREVHTDQSPAALVKDSLYVSAFDGYLRALVSGAGVKGRPGWDTQKLDKVFEEGRKYADSAFAPIVYFRMAQAKLKLGDESMAVDYCRRAVDAAENNETLASEVLLRMYLLLGSEEVFKYCQEKLRASPDSLPAHITMYNLYKISGDYEKALVHIDKCLELTPPGGAAEVDFRIKRAEILTFAYDRSSDKQYLTAAVTEYESLLQKQPNNHSVLNNLAYMLADSGERLSKALTYAEKAVQLRPNDPSISDTYGYVLHKNGKHVEAAERLAFAIQQYEQSDTIAPPEVYEHLGMVREAAGAKKEALTAYREALETGGETLSEAVKDRLTKAIERLSR